MTLEKSFYKSGRSKIVKDYDGSQTQRHSRTRTTADQHMYKIWSTKKTLCGDKFGLRVISKPWTMSFLTHLLNINLFSILPLSLAVAKKRQNYFISCQYMWFPLFFLRPISHFISNQTLTNGPNHLLHKDNWFLYKYFQYILKNSI